MRQRVITSTIFALLMLGGVFGGKYTFFALFGVVAIGCLWELTGLLFEKGKYRWFRRMMGLVMGMSPYIFSGWSIVCGGYLHEHMFWRTIVLELVLFFVLMILELGMRSNKPFENLGLYVVGILYIGIPFTLLTDIAMWTGVFSPLRVFGMMWLIWTSDVAAFVFGRNFGKNKLWERISPNKTWEGFGGAVLWAVGMGWLCSLFIPDFTTTQWIFLGLNAAIFGTIGDLVESMLKRSVAVKDSGDMFPGHGGFLDRFDALMFSLPFAWAFLMILRYS
jgi:phosphatidate cytidylyltransferase